MVGRLIGIWVVRSAFRWGIGGDNVVGDLVGGRVVSDCLRVCVVIVSVILCVGVFPVMSGLLMFQLGWMES